MLLLLLYVVFLMLAACLIGELQSRVSKKLRENAGVKI
jgi:hypothetical protein